MSDDARWMAAAVSIAQRAQAAAFPNPNVGCIILCDQTVVGRGWTQAGGRPHAEAMALEAAGGAARGATAYVTLEPCAHQSDRGSACADSLIAAGVARVVVGIEDPDPRTAGKGLARLQAAGIKVSCGVLANAARASMAGWLSIRERGRPYVTLKLATSLDGCIAMNDGCSRWITGDAARAHGHVVRSNSSMIVVGRGTFAADAPRLDVRLTGLEDRSPRRAILSHTPAPDGWETLASPDAVRDLADVPYLLVEGGASAAAAFLSAGLVDRILHYQAPVLIGGGQASLSDIGLSSLADAHGQWQRVDQRRLGSDTLSVYDRI
jgi:diaminohydroxyphosphoribosylaminopyrimidine deaminase / 5-amino-6-(5-phosphoribosylamino)uracil reductase